MLKHIVLTVQGTEYRLRLTSAAIVSIEKKLGRSMFDALEHIQENLIETVTVILWGSMQALNDGIPLEKVYDIFDAYIDEGNCVEDIVQIISQVLQTSGFFKKGQA